jgi:hypothetical protein
MTVVRQSKLEDLDGFQIDWDQFLVSYDLGCDIVEAFSYSLRDACKAGDRLTACAIIWFMLVANGLYVPPRVYACQCVPSEVEPLIRDLCFEARRGNGDELRGLLVEAARAAGIYGAPSLVMAADSPVDVTPWRRWGISPSKN